MDSIQFAQGKAQYGAFMNKETSQKAVTFRIFQATISLS
jgi:hypothetical protein